MKGLAGTTAYLYLDAIEIAKRGEALGASRARGADQGRADQAAGQADSTRVRNLHDLSDGVEAYKDLFVTDIDANRDVIELSNGDVVVAGQLADRDVTEESKRRIQIREVIRAHLDKERELFAQDIKVLSLFFIDEVAKYRDYDREDTLGDYARVFEEEYTAAVAEMLRRTRTRRGDGGVPGSTSSETTCGSIHEGYFSIDKKTKHLVDPDGRQDVARRRASRATSTPTT